MSLFQHQFVCTVISNGPISDYVAVEDTARECLDASVDGTRTIVVEYKGCREMTETGAKIYEARKLGVTHEKKQRKPAKFVKPVGA